MVTLYDEAGVAAELVSRSSTLRPDQLLRLDGWARTVLSAFGCEPRETSMYLVGSVCGGGPYRDVDVRCILPDDDPIFREGSRVLALNVAFSVWAQQTTGLPVDFQFQPQSHADAYKGTRNPLGTRWGMDWIEHAKPRVPVGEAGDAA